MGRRLVWTWVEGRSSHSRAALAGWLAAPIMLATAGTVWAAGVPCADLAAVSIDPAMIGLPTRGARVVTAESVAAGGGGAAAVGEYCKLTAEILPIDDSAPTIRLIVNLPKSWNGKGLMFGGGGYDGGIPPTNGNIPAGPQGVSVPLARGYATFSSDSGHQANQLGSQDGSFGMNDEALRNFSGDALKKTRDAAVALVKAHYGAARISRMYFVGGSSGGREALAVVQRWPAEWDGAIALYPAWNAASLDLQFGRITRALAAPGAYPNQAKRQALYDAAMEACDGLDGVKDGVISNVAACNAAFDPATARLKGQPLRCAEGRDTGDGCLSDAQIAALKVYDSAITFRYPLGSHETQYPGFNVWGTDLGLAKADPLQARIIFLALGTEQPASPMPAKAPYGSVFWDQWARFFVTRDASFNSLDLDPENPGRWAARIAELTALQDVNQTDLSAFRARGGKLLLAHGTADALVSTRATEQYYARLQQTMGKAKTAGFVRYYEIPGYGHALSTVFNAAWDSLAALEGWVEKGKEPKNQLVFDTAGVPGRSRPLCEYPAWPRYKGAGDVNAAGSFVCVKE